ncbi:MAG: hypothetical protein GC200_06890 [Tepidisphaera sp.]|nr:hypothetical protein [Tepidisphaera sp.]
MTEHEQQPMAMAGGATPPTDADVLGDVQLGEPVGWPKVVGILSIVWGSLGLLGGVCGVIGLVATPILMANAPGFDPNNMPPTMVMGPLKILLFTLGFCMSGLLLFAGITTVGRRDVGRLAHLVWAFGGLLVLLLQLWVQFGDAKAMEAWIAANQSSPFAKGGTAGIYIGLGVAVVLGLPWPLFLMVWFGLIKNKPGAMRELKAGY